MLQLEQPLLNHFKRTANRLVIRQAAPHNFSFCDSFSRFNKAQLRQRYVCDCQVDVDSQPGAENRKLPVLLALVKARSNVREGLLHRFDALVLIFKELALIHFAEGAEGREGSGLEQANPPMAILLRVSRLAKLSNRGFTSLYDRRIRAIYFPLESRREVTKLTAPPRA